MLYCNDNSKSLWRLHDDPDLISLLEYQPDTLSEGGYNSGGHVTGELRYIGRIYITLDSIGFIRNDLINRNTCNCYICALLIY